MLTKDDLDITHFHEALEQCVCKNDPVKVVLDLPLTEIVVVSAVVSRSLIIRTYHTDCLICYYNCSFYPSTNKFRIRNFKPGSRGVCTKL